MMWKKIAAVVLILVGIVLIFSDRINDQYINYQAKNTIKEAMEITPVQIKENTEQTLPGPLEEERFDFDQVEPININESWQSLLDQVLAQEPEKPVPGTGTAVTNPGTTGGNKGPTSTMTEEQAKAELKKYSQKYIIGIIKIPAIRLELGILKGVLNRNLYMGAGTMRSDQVMGQRNYPLAAHHTQSYGVLFNRVPELKAGQMLYITDKETIYTYRVYTRKKVHETEIEVIYDSVAKDRGKPVLTLSTCFNLKEPESRIIVQGELVGSQPYSEETFAALK